MKLVACAVYDEKARAFMVPFFTSNIEVAKRSFGAAARTPNQLISQNPEDFTLYQLGTFDDITGQVEQFAQKVFLGKATNFLPGEAHAIAKVA